MDDSALHQPARVTRTNPDGWRGHTAGTLRGPSEAFSARQRSPAPFIPPTLPPPARQKTSHCDDPPHGAPAGRLHTSSSAAKTVLDGQAGSQSAAKRGMMGGRSVCSPCNTDGCLYHGKKKKKKPLSTPLTPPWSETLSS